MKTARDSIWFNVQFWFAYFVYEWLANAAVDNEYYRYFINALVIVPITMIASWFTVHVLFQKLYLKDRKHEFWIYFIVSMIGFVLMRRAFNYYYTYPMYYPEGNLTMPYLFLPKLIIEGVNNYLIVGLYSMFYFVRAWYEQQRLTHELLQKKTEAEFQLLKSQVRPHFIFNTLNNIYSYAIQKNEKVPDLIHRLSSFLSYNLYESKSDTIALSKELEYINSYIELERMRYGSRLDVSFNVYNAVEHFQISPLLLLPLVENAFKHGFTTALSECWLRIDVMVHHDWLTVKIENSVSATREPRRDEKNGLGMENVKGRLAIIYPEQHEFKIVEEEDSFLVILKIKNLES